MNSSAEEDGNLRCKEVEKVRENEVCLQWGSAEGEEGGKPLGLAQLDWKQVCPWRGSSERDTKDELALRPLPEVAAFISAQGSTNVQEMMRRESLAITPSCLCLLCLTLR